MKASPKTAAPATLRAGETLIEKGWMDGKEEKENLLDGKLWDSHFKIPYFAFKDEENRNFKLK